MSRFIGNAEPHLDELLGDPIAQLLMRRDGLATEEVRAVVEDAQRRRASAAPSFHVERVVFD